MPYYVVRERIEDSHHLTYANKEDESSCCRSVSGGVALCEGADVSRFRRTEHTFRDSESEYISVGDCQGTTLSFLHQLCDCIQPGSDRGVRGQ